MLSTSERKNKSTYQVAMTRIFRKQCYLFYESMALSANILPQVVSSKLVFQTKDLESNERLHELFAQCNVEEALSLINVVTEIDSHYQKIIANSLLSKVVQRFLACKPAKVGRKIEGHTGLMISFCLPVYTALSSGETQN